MPIENNPSDNVPQAPHTPWTEIAPTGSSILRYLSIATTENTTKIPATNPMASDAPTVTQAQGHVIATKPAKAPLSAMVASHLPNIARAVNSAAMATDRRRGIGVDRDVRDQARLGRHRAAGIESEPPQPEDEHAERDQHQVVAGNGLGCAVGRVLANARAENKGTDQATTNRRSYARRSSRRSPRSLVIGAASRHPISSGRRSDK